MKKLLVIIRFIADILIVIIAIKCFSNNEVSSAVKLLVFALLTFLPEIVRWFSDMVEKSKIRRLYKDIFHSLKNFIEKISDDNKVLGFFSEKVKGVISAGGVELKEPEKRIRLFMDYDIVYCYMQMGIDLECVLENFEPFNAYLKALNFRIPVRNNGKTYFAAIYDRIERGSDELFLGHCLERIDKEYYREYCSLLLSYSLMTAELCPELDPDKTEQWLKELSCYSDDTQADESIEPGYSALAELDSLIGLEPVKKQIRTMMNFLKVMKKREEKGLKTSPVSYHCVFTGNPGTGKTTVARIVAHIYKELGILEKGHLVETDRSGLVGQWIGETAVKTNAIIDKALDGVLFIDEAYSLFVKESPNDYGPEAIATLLKRMEDDRDRLVVILAGYNQEMEKFMKANPGLKSRFNRYIDFPDYNAEELYRIFSASVEKYEYRLSYTTAQLVHNYMIASVASKDRNFGNGRFVRNLFEKVVECQADRLSGIDNPDKDTLMEILPEDVAKAFTELTRR